MAEPLRKPDPNIIWAAFPGSQQAFLACPYLEVLYDGERGPGKTMALWMDFCQHVGQGFGSSWRGVIFRRKFSEFGKMIAEMQDWIPRFFPGAQFIDSPGGAKGYSWRFPGGEFLQLSRAIHSRDIKDHLGFEWPWIGWDELCSWATIELYEAMMATNRAAKPGMPRKVRSTTNSWGPGYAWVKHRFVAPAPERCKIPTLTYTDAKGRKVTEYRVRIQGYLHENRMLARNDPAYRAKLEAISDPNLRTAWIGGEDVWAIQAGGYLGGVWSESVHVLEPFKIPASWYVNRSYDWGSAKPFSIQWWAESDGTEVRGNGHSRTFPAGSLFLIEEWYGTNGKPNEGLNLPTPEVILGIQDHEDRLGRIRLEDRYIAAGPADSNIFEADPGEPTIADRMQEAGIYWERANKRPGSRRQRGRRMLDMLAEALKDKPEDPCLYVFDTPGTRRGFIATAPGLQRSDKDPDDVDTNGEDHSYDAAGYRLLARRAVIESGKRGF